MQLTPSLYHHMAALFVAYKQLGFLEPTPEEFAFIYHSRKWHSYDVNSFWNIKSKMGQWKGRWF